MDMDLSGIKGDLKTTVMGGVAIAATVALIFKAIDLQTWMAVCGFALGGGLVLTNSTKESIQ
jgi:hypothetical protein